MRGGSNIQSANSIVTNVTYNNNQAAAAPLPEFAGAEPNTPPPTYQQIFGNNTHPPSYNSVTQTLNRPPTFNELMERERNEYYRLRAARLAQRRTEYLADLERYRTGFTLENAMAV